MSAELVYGRELVFSDGAELTLEIIGEIFPFYAGLFFIVDPAANVAYIFHG